MAGKLFRAVLEHLGRLSPKFVSGKTGKRFIIATSDAGGDGMRDLDEYYAGTGPHDLNGAFKVISIEPDAGKLVLLRWSSVAGKTYAIEKSGDLGSGFFSLISLVLATPPANRYLDVRSPGRGTVCCRICVW